MALPTYQSSVTSEVVPLTEVAGKENLALVDTAKQVGQVESTAEKYMATTDVLNTTSDLKNKFVNNYQGPDSVKQADAAYSTYAQQTINHTSFENRPYMSAMLAQNYASLNSELAAKNQTYLKAQSGLEYNKNFYTTKGAMENALQQVAALPSQEQAGSPEMALALTLHSNAVNMSNQAALMGNISPESASANINNITDSLHTNYVLAQYRNAKQLQQQDPTKYADAPTTIRQQFVGGKYDAQIRPDQKQSVNNGFDAIDKEFSDASLINKENIGNQITNVKQSVLATGGYDGTTYGNIIAADPKKAQDFVTTIAAYQDVHNQIAEAQGSYDKFEQLSNRLALPLSNDEATSPNAFATLEARKAGKSWVDSVLRQATTDPAILSESTPLVQQQIAAVKSSPEYINEQDPFKKMMTLMSGTAKANIAQQKFQQIPDDQIKGLSDAESANIAQMINSAPDLATQTSNLLSVINSFPADQQPYVIKGMQKYLPASSQYLMNANANPDTAYLTPYLAAAYSKKISDFSDTLTNHQTTLDKVKQAVISSPSYQSEMAMLQSQAGDPVAALSDFQNHALKATLQLMESRTLSTSDAADLATRAQVGQATYHSFLTNGSTIKTPVDVGFTDLHNAMSYLMDKSSQDGITLNPKVVAHYGEHPDIRTIEGLTLNTASFINNSMNNGIVLIDQEGNIVKDKSGNPVGVTFDQIKDPTFQAGTVTPYLHNLAQQKLLSVNKLSDLQGMLNENASKIASNYVSLPTFLVGSLGDQGRFGFVVNPNKQKKSIVENISREFGG